MKLQKIIMYLGLSPVFLAAEKAGALDVVPAC